MTYLRRMLVPKAKSPVVINYLKANVTPHLMVKELNIGGNEYYAIKFVSATPVIVQGDTVTIARKGTKPSVASILKNIYATDKDIQSSIIVDATDYSNLNNNVADDYDVTVTISDPNGETGTVEYTVTVADTTSAVITLSALIPVEVEIGDAGTWDPTTYIQSAVDDGDDVSASVVLTYKKTDADGDDLADLAAARTWLGTEGNSVFIMYNYTDASGNVAEEKTHTITAVDSGGGE